MGVTISYTYSAELCLPDTVSWQSFRFVQQSDIRLNLNNTALFGNALPDIRISTARVFGENQSGYFANYSQSPNSFTLGAETQSYFRVSPRLIFHGLVSYRNFYGKEMGGSVFTNPDDAPFNIVEYADTTRGAKQQEVYQMLGAFTCKLFTHTNIGAKIDYTSSNYAKRKDLRHRNKLLDFTTTVGVSHNFGRLMEMGLNVLYRKSVEGVYFNRYGTTDKPYVSLIDFGSSYGRTQVFTEQGSGYTSGKTERPLIDEYLGGAIQLQLNLSKHTKLFNQVSFQKRTGYFGIKSASSVVYTQHRGQAFSYIVSGSVSANKNTHRIDIGLKNELLANYENVYTVENEPGGYSYIVYHDKNQMLDQTRWQFHGNYIGNFGINGYASDWTVEVASVINNQQRLTSVFPFFRKQNLTHWHLQASCYRNKFLKTRFWEFGLGTAYGMGHGKPFENGMYIQSENPETSAKTADFNLLAEYDFITAPRISIHPALRYGFVLKNNSIASVQLKYDYTQVLKTSFATKNNRHNIALAFQYEF